MISWPARHLERLSVMVNKISFNAEILWRKKSDLVTQLTVEKLLKTFSSVRTVGTLPKAPFTVLRTVLYDRLTLNNGPIAALPTAFWYRQIIIKIFSESFV